jgi:FKBP-type peptidyl-prolyl cis-trans isomerase
MPLAQRNLKAGEEFMAKNRDTDGVSMLPSGVQYKILEQGKGPKPTTADGVSVHYKGTLIDGQEFDNSYKRGEPFRFMVNGGVIKGWQEVLPLMPVGSKWRVFIPPHMAYGESGRGGLIGPNATLIFDIELLRILKPEEVGEKK